jgi:muramoyltetrapeptide carboxypeptidase
MMNIGITAPSSVVPSYELELGVRRLKKLGHEIVIHPQVYDNSFIYAGLAENRASAFYDFSVHPKLSVVWAARGGYGGLQFVDALDLICRKKGKPPQKKLFLGCSDSTVILEYVRREWKWHTLHALMPGVMTFQKMKAKDLKVLGQLIERPKAKTWPAQRLKVITPVRGPVIQAPLVGGNLTVLTSMVGTPAWGSLAGKILFLEDISETPARIDRMLGQLRLSGCLTGVKAIVLGDFLECEDRVADVWIKKTKKAPLRQRLLRKEWIPLLFGELGLKLGVPVFSGLPCGHGPGYLPLPIGAVYQLTPGGVLSLKQWGWTGQKR